MGEITLRLLKFFKITGPTFGICEMTSIYNERVGLLRKPDSFIVAKQGEELINRKVNSLGFPDKEHQKKSLPMSIELDFLGILHVQIQLVVGKRG